MSVLGFSQKLQGEKLEVKSRWPVDLAAVMGGGACASVAWGARTASPLQGSGEENHSEAWSLWDTKTPGSCAGKGPEWWMKARLHLWEKTVQSLSQLICSLSKKRKWLSGVIHQPCEFG